MIELKNCPHCGKPAQSKTIDKPYRHGWVGCPNCGIYKNWTYSIKEAVEIWNRRVKE